MPLYVGVGSAGILVFDISDRESPLELGSYDTDGEVNGLSCVASKLFVADGSNGAVILDISNPAAITAISTTATSVKAEPRERERSAPLLRARPSTVTVDRCPLAGPSLQCIAAQPGHGHGQRALSPSTAESLQNRETQRLYRMPSRMLPGHRNRTKALVPWPRTPCHSTAIVVGSPVVLSTTEA